MQPLRRLGEFQLVFLLIVLSTAIFLADLLTPLGVAAGVLYVAPMLVAMWSSRPAVVYATAGAGSVLVVAGYLLSPAGGLDWMVLANRGLTLAMLWAVLFGCWSRRREADERRRAQEQGSRLAAIVEASDDAILSFTPTGELLTWNLGAQNLIGYSAEEVKRESPTILFAPERREDWRQICEDARAGRHILKRETVWRRQDGSLMEVSLSISPIHDQLGALSGFAVIARDTTEDKRRERELQALNETLDNRVRQRTQALEEAEARYRDLYDNAPDMMALIGVEGGTILECNYAFADAAGRSKEELIGRSFLDLYDEPSRQAALETLEHFAATGEIFNPERTVRMESGRRVETLLKATPVRDETGKIVASRSIWRDVTELKTAQRRLAAQESLYRTLVEALPNIIWRATPDGQTTFLNKAWERVTGHSIATDSGSGWADRLHPDDRPKLLAEWEQARRQEETLRGEYRLRARDGSYRHFTFVATPVRDTAGQVTEWIGICTDDTEAKQAVDRLRREEERLRLVEDLATDGMWDRDLESDREYLSPRFKATLGYEDHELPNRSSSWEKLIHPDDRKKVDAAFRRHIDQDEPYNLQVRFRHKNGSTVWMLRRGVALRARSGKCSRMVGIHTNITAMKEIEEALRESQERLQLTLEAGQIGTWVWNLKDDALIADANLRQMYGLKEDSGRQQFLDRVHPEDIEGLNNSIQTTLTGGADFKAQYRVVVPEGEVRHISARGSVLRDSEGQPVKMAGVCVDMTQRVEAEQRLVMMAGELARSNQDLEQFAYIASHDLRAPLRAIGNLADWIEEDLPDALDGETKRNMDLLRGRVSRLQRLIDDLLKYSRAGRVKGEVGPVDVAEILKEAVGDLEPPDGFRIEIAEPLPVFETLCSALQQVFANLIGNAVKHHDRSDGRVQVSCRDSGDFYEFEVKDDGPGIPPDSHDRVFQIFQTLKPRDEVEGSGVGLAIVKRLVERQGGQLVLEAKEGRGATFRFTWPKVIKETPAYERTESDRELVAR